jgi:hypothetical protein
MMRIDLFKSRNLRKYLESDSPDAVDLVQESRTTPGLQWKVARITIGRGVLTRALVEMAKAEDA